MWGFNEPEAIEEADEENNELAAYHFKQKTLSITFSTIIKICVMQRDAQSTEEGKQWYQSKKPQALNTIHNYNH